MKTNDALKSVSCQDLTPYLLLFLLCAIPAAAGSDAPTCTRHFDVAASTAEIQGRVTAAPGQSQGLRDARLAVGARNLLLKLDSSFQPGDAQLEFFAQPVNRFQDAEGVVIGEDAGGRTCSLPVVFRAMFNRTNPAQLCRSGDIALDIRNPRISEPGISGCSVTDLGPGEPPLPAEYRPLPGSPFDPFPCRVLTVDSPLLGLNEMILSKTGRLQPGERFLFSASLDGGLTFPEFVDITEEIAPQRSFRPVTTRWRGIASGTPFKVTCALAPVPGKTPYD